MRYWKTHRWANFYALVSICACIITLKPLNAWSMGLFLLPDSWSSAASNVCTLCASCWRTESHYKIMEAIYWLQSVRWRPSGSLKPNSGAPALCWYRKVLPQTRSFYTTWHVFLIHNIMRIAQLHPYEIVIGYLIWGPPRFLFNGYGDCFPGVKRPERDINRLPSFSADIKNGWSYPFTPLYAFMARIGTICFIEWFFCFRVGNERLDLRWAIWTLG